MGWSILKKKLEEEEAAVVFIISPLLSDCHIDQLLILRLLGWYKLVLPVTEEQCLSLSGHLFAIFFTDVELYWLFTTGEYNLFIISVSISHKLASIYLEHTQSWVVVFQPGSE